MDNNLRMIGEAQAKKVQKSLIARQFDCQIVEDEKEASAAIKRMIPANSIVALGGSMTLEQIGMLEELKKMPIQLQDRYAPNLSKEQRDEILRQAFTSDVYLMGTNAITLNGELLNVDGTGNRVTALCFGPKKVIVVVGVNKIVMDEEAGWSRIRRIAAPANCVRLAKKTPCASVGYCQNCASDQRICNQFVKIERCRYKDRISVIIVLKDLGY